MSKKKRLGRGLEALLGVGSKDKGTSEKEVSPGEKSDGFDIQSDSSEVTSIDDLMSTKESAESSVDRTEDTTPEEPSILPFVKDQEAPSKPRSFDSTGPKVLALDGSTQSTEEPYPPSILDSQQTKTESSDSSENAGGLQDSGQTTVELNVYDVDDNPFQPRREFNKSEIESLAESLKTHEQLQPILVRRTGDRYQLISGERRLRAAIHAGWSKILAQVREADDRLVAELAIVENLQRKDLNPIEKAFSFRRYIDEHRCSQEDLAGRLKIDRSTVANLLRLLELPEVVQKALQVALISNGHARALLPLGEEHLQIEFCNRIQREGLSVRATEQLVRDKIEEEDGIKRKPAAKSRTKSSQILSLEQEMKNGLGTKVEIKPSSRGRGKIIVHYASRDEFERLRQYFGGSDPESSIDAA